MVWICSVGAFVCFSTLVLKNAVAAKGLVASDAEEHLDSPADCSSVARHLFGVMLGGARGRFC